MRWTMVGVALVLLGMTLIMMLTALVLGEVFEEYAGFDCLPPRDDMEVCVRVVEE